MKSSLRLIKAPLFRGIDSCPQVLATFPIVLASVRFEPDNIRLDPAIHATARANELAVKEGIPFREAYRRAAAELASKASLSK